MAVELATGYVTIVPSTKGFARSLVNEAGSAGTEAGEAASGNFGGRFVGGLKTMAKTATVALGGVGVAAGSLGLKMAAANETAAVGFATLLGSGEKAEAFMKDLADFAARTPFELPGLRDSASKFLAVGIEAKRVIPIMTTLGDATAAMGTGAPGIERATYALQQMMTKGKVTAEEMMQLSEAGIPAWDALASVLKVDVATAQDMVFKRQVSANKMFEALETRSGPALQRVAGMMDKQALSLTGMISTLKDVIGQGLASMMAPTVVAIKETLPQVTDLMMGAMETVGPLIAEAFGGLLRSLTSIIPVAGKVIGAVASAAAAAMKVLAPVVEAVGPALGEAVAMLGNTIARFITTLGPGLVSIAKAAAPIAKIFGEVASVIGDSFAVVLAELADLMADIVPLLVADLGLLVEAVAPVITALGEGLAGIIGDTMFALVPLVAELSGGLLHVFQQLIPVAAQFIDALLPFVGTFVDLLKGALAALVTLLEPLAILFETLLNAILPLLPALLPVATLLAGALVQAFTALAPLIVGVVMAILPLIPIMVDLGGRLLVEVVSILALMAPVLVALAAAFIPIIPLIAQLVQTWLGRFGELLLNAAPAMEALLKASLPLVNVMTPFLVILAQLVTWLGESKVGMALLTALFATFVTAKATKGILDFILPGQDFISTIGLMLLGMKVFTAYQATAALTGMSRYKTMLTQVVFGQSLATIGQAALNVVMSPWFLWPVAIAAVAAAIYLAYTKFEPFRQAVDAVIVALRQAFDWIKELFGAILGGDSEKAAKMFADLADNIRNALGAFIASLPGWIGEGLKIIGGYLTTFLSQIPGWASTALNAVVGILGNVGQGAGGLFMTLLGNIPGWVANLLQGLGGLLLIFLSNLPGWLATGLSAVRDALVNAVTGAFSWVMDNWQNIVKGLLLLIFALPLLIIGGLVKFGPMLFDWFKGAIGWLIDNAPGALGALWEFVETIPGRLLELFLAFNSFLADFFTAAAQWLVTNGPTIFATIWGFVSSIPGKILEGLASFASFIFTFFVSAVAWLVTNGATLVISILDFVTDIPGKLLAGLGVAIGWLLEFMVRAAFWLAENAPKVIDPVVGFFQTLPGKIVDGLVAFNSMIYNFFLSAFTWLADNLLPALVAVMNWFQGLPGRIWGWIGNLGGFLFDRLLGTFQWITTELPEILGSVIDWFEGLPGKIWAAMGSLGQKLIDGMQAAFNLVVTRGPGMISGLINFMADLPNKIFGAITGALGRAGGVALDLGRAIYNAVIGFLNDKALGPIKNFTVPFMGTELTPFQSLPLIPRLARGGPLDANQLALVGEEGPELFVANRAGRIIPNSASVTTDLAPAAGAGLVIEHFEVKGGDTPLQTAFAVAEELRWAALTRGVS